MPARIVPAFRLAPLALVLAACALPGGPVPVEARLSSERLAVTLSDGRTCRADRPLEVPEGPLAGCPAGWRYAVAADPGTNPVRLVVEAVLTALTLEGALAPRATVSVTDAAGRTTAFVSPPAPAAGD